MKNYAKLDFKITLIFLVVTVIMSIVAFNFWYELIFFVGSYIFIHWLGIIAALFILISVPVYYVLKRTKPQSFKKILRIHVLGNIFAFLLISMHFFQNLGRLAGSLQRLGTGFVLYLFLTLIVTTGVLEMYQTNGKLHRIARIIHKYGFIFLYSSLIIHMMEGFNVL